MTEGPIRIYGRGHLHFITFSSYRRAALLGSVRARNTFVQILDEVHNRYGFALVGFVVMPEHIHLAGGKPFLVFSVDEMSRRDNTTAVCQH